LKNKILELIKSSRNNDDDFNSLSSIFNLYEQLQYSANILQMAEDIYDWLNTEFNIDNVNFALFDINSNSREEILVKGEDFYLDDEFSCFFIINTQTNLNATVSFSATSNVHFQIIQEKYTTIEAAFFQVSPIIQNGIIKKNFIESSSLDSVTNVYTRNYLVDNLTKHLSLSKNTKNQIFFLMIGIDHFKAVIDEFDYDTGDNVLIELAKVIHSSINEFDMVARLNADEFLVTILSGVSEFEAEEISQKIIKDFSSKNISVNQESQQTLLKTVCIGFDILDINSDHTIPDAIKNADISLYEAKNLGRSKLFKYSQLKETDTLELF
jgi:diguanylate cyclase (GGDEF)-like protein